MKRPVIKRSSAIVLALALLAGTDTEICGAEVRTIPEVGIALVPIPAGTFMMGSPPSEAGRDADDEGPQTQVTITRPFWIGRTEVTQAQWRTLMGTNVVEQARLTLQDDTLFNFGGKKLTYRESRHKSRDSDPRELVFNDANDAPMYWVKWDEAVAYCRKLTSRGRERGNLPDGYEYRLPTEAEWEYACRAATRTATYAGDLEILGKFNAPTLDKIAWYGGNSTVGYEGKGGNPTDIPERQYPGPGTAGQRTVGTKAPNAWGLFDMIGNVGEWCLDPYTVKLLPGGEVNDLRAVSGNQRVARGGSFVSPAQLCRAAERAPWARGMRFWGVGFRVALAATQVVPADKN